MILIRRKLVFAFNNLCTFTNERFYFFRESELCLARGDREGAESAARKVLEKSNDSPILKVRALYTIARASPKSAVLSLTDAYHIASYYYIDYWAALIALEMANIQARTFYSLIIYEKLVSSIFVSTSLKSHCVYVSGPTHSILYYVTFFRICTHRTPIPEDPDSNQATDRIVSSALLAAGESGGS